MGVNKAFSCSISTDHQGMTEGEGRACALQEASKTRVTVGHGSVGEAQEAEQLGKQLGKMREETREAGEPGVGGQAGCVRKRVVALSGRTGGAVALAGHAGKAAALGEHAEALGMAQLAMGVTWRSQTLFALGVKHWRVAATRRQ
ncbi:unnamed protein product [Ilex paraguariensis]|uniref:Uncharacterized protein n=1 Tax=Ilex paraguariensis TaxID=185542 RepID=A0ABC8UPD3_9AQUA